MKEDKFVLEIKNLSVLYKSTGRLAVRNVSFKVRRGEILALLGPSGCGKTTILNTIANLFEPKEVEIKGEILFSGTGDGFKISIVFQDPRLLPWRTVLRNVTFGLEAQGFDKKAATEKAKKYIRMVGLEGFENYYPHELSLGMQQRVNFSRALICAPTLLLLDEPFSSLDVETKEKLQKEFLQILRDQKITSIFVTHNVEEAFYLAQRIIILSKGPAVVENILERKDFKKVPQEALNYLEPFED